MELYRNRLATFFSSIPWPHVHPAPEQLAAAGFYHKPTELSPDNTACFLCERALDGWEADDDPLSEHAKHSPDCGWAVIRDLARWPAHAYAEQLENGGVDGDDEFGGLEDPTGARLTAARRATFGNMWPHSGKRGWLCKPDKMVEAGWYYCPVEGSDDFVSCPYCKLSLDGWEPKDDPFDEHFRRSPDCIFFAMARPKTQKRGAPRVRGSRARTSAVSASSDDVSMADEAPKPKLRAKKGRTARGATPFEQRPPPSRKRPSEANDEGAAQPPKRRTRKPKVDVESESDARARESSVLVAEPAPAPKKRGRPSKKSATSKTAESKSESAAPDAAIDAALEADLDAEPEPSMDQNADSHENVKEDEEAESPPHSMQHAGVEVASSQQRGATGSGQANRKTGSAGTSDIDTDQQSAEPQSESEPEPGHEEQESPKPKKRGRPAKQTRPPTQAKQPAKKPVKQIKRMGKQEKHAATRWLSGASGQTKGRRLQLTTAKEETEGEEEQETEQDEQSDAEEEMSSQQQTQPTRARHESGSDEKHDHPHQQPNHLNTTTSPAVRSPAPVQTSTPSPSPQSSDAENRPPSAGRHAPHPAASETEIGPQEQSPEQTAPEKTGGTMPDAAAAENQQSAPAPSTPTLTMASPAKTKKTVTIPLAATPTTRLPGRLAATRSWEPIDIDEVLLADLGSGGFGEMAGGTGGPIDSLQSGNDPESGNLTSLFRAAAASGGLSAAERGMSVEEWIGHNARAGEARLRRECERLVNRFESEGGRAMAVLESIECAD